MRTQRTIAAVVGGLLVVSLATSSPAAAEPPAPAPTAAPVSSQVPASVTLITGDRVIATPQGNFVFDPAPGREHIHSVATRLGERHYVIPADALALVRAGELDRRLFDIALLLEFGYDDQRGDLPLIVIGGGAPAALSSAGQSRPLPAVDGLAVRVATADLPATWAELTRAAQPGERTLAAGVSTVLLDGLRQPLLAESVPQVGAPSAWDAGYDGDGTTVAVLDTGIDANHPDLADRIAGAQNFTEGEEDDRDLFGHGTHVGSIVAGSGAASDGAYQGVAPGAQLLDGKVCAEFGCAESWILAGMQWAAEQGADVINMSLGGPASPDGDPIEEAVQTLTEAHGVLFVISAGNSGEDASIGSPGTAEAAVTVGAVDKQDELADFSSRGPKLDGSLKPDLTGPGVEIVAARSADGFLGEPGESYTTLSGTSMSSPHVAGAAAILRQQHPDWTPAQLKAALLGSAAPHPELGPYAQGAGRLDVARAVTAPVLADPPSVSFDRTEWPHDDDQPQTRTVSYQNHGDEDLTLELAVTTVGPEGAPAPDGFFTLGESSVTVPAGGEAQVTITVDTSVGERDGFFGGHLLATGDLVAVSTPFAVDREVESYDVTLPHTNRAGEPASGSFTSLVRLDAYGVVDVFVLDSAPTVRVPAGEYALMSFVDDVDGDAFSTSLLGLPRVTVDGAQTIEVDAQRAEPISVTVPDPAAEPAFATVGADVITDQIWFGFSVLGDDFESIYSGQLGEGGPAEEFSSQVSGAFVEPAEDGSIDSPAYSYDLAWSSAGEMITGFVRDVAPEDLATIEADHARHVPGTEGWKASFASWPHVAGGWAVVLPAELPFTRTEHHNTDGEVRWAKELSEERPVEGDDFPELVSYLSGEPVTYQAGATYQESWNYAVFAPTFDPHFPALSRAGDELLVEAGLYGDAAGRWLSSPHGASATAVYWDGEQIGEFEGSFGSVEVPPGEAELRVELVGERGEVFPLATETTLAWTFRSDTSSGDDPELLPVSVIRFAPELDPQNSAKAGALSLLPVEVVPQPDSAAGDVRRLTVEVSYDDGESWQRAPVLPWLGGKRAVLWHPRDAEFVSLRATATDRAGATVEQTIIRAYHLG